MIISPQSGSPSAWSWFSIRVEKVRVAPSGLGAHAVRKHSLECHGFRRTTSLRTTSNRTTSRRTTSARKTSRLDRTVFQRTVSREQFLSNSRARRTTSRITTSHQRQQRRRTQNPSLRTPSPSSLRARTCTSQKGFSTQIVRRKGSVARHWHSAAYRVWSTLNKSSAGRVHTQHHGTRLAKIVDSDFTVSFSHRQPSTNNTIHICCSHRTHWVHASLSRREKIDKNAIFKEILEIGRCGGREW